MKRQRLLKKSSSKTTVNIYRIRDYFKPTMPMQGWTAKHDALLQELVHHTRPGGFNERNPPLSWKEIGEHFHWLAPQRGLGNKTFPWNKIAARYYEHIKPLYEKLDQDLAMNTARNTGRNLPSKGKVKAKEGANAGEEEGQDFFETLEGWEEAREGSRKATEDGVGKKGFFDIMEQMDKEEQTTKGE